VKNPTDWVCGITACSSELGYSERHTWRLKTQGDLEFLEQGERGVESVVQSLWARRDERRLHRAETSAENGRRGGRPVTVCSAGTSAQAAGNLTTLSAPSISPVT
jgi:hypothetical protein